MPYFRILFLLVAEIIAINIRNDSDINVITVSGSTEFKINLMADDTTLFLTDIKSLSIAIEKFKQFQICSGLKLNTMKTEVIPIGKNQGKHIILPVNIKEIKIGQGPFKALGVWFSTNDGKIIDLNFTEKINKMNTILNIWRSRNLSLKGKITIIKTLVLPQIQFLFSMLHVPNEILKKLDVMLFNFLWSGKPPKIKRETIIAPIKNGGLAMVDVFTVHTSAKIGWIKRLLDARNCNWKTLFWKMLNIDPDVLIKNTNINHSANGLSNFHKQLLSSWISISSINPTTRQEILTQYLFHNQHIKIDNKVITQKFIDNLSKDTRITHIIDRNNKLLTLPDFNAKFKINIPQWRYNSIISAIPQNWKSILKKEACKNTDSQEIESNEPYIRIGRTLKTYPK